jgi:hypothetical protein
VNVRLGPKCLILSGFMPLRDRVLALSSFQGDFLLMTAIALNNDYILGRIKLDSFDIVVFDEAHRVVAQGEELGQYRYSVHYKQLALNLIALKGIVVLGLTIPETERTSETESNLAAIGVASETAKAPKTEIYAVLFESNEAIKGDLWFRAQMWWALNSLRKVLGKKIPWKISEARLIEILEEMELPERRYKGYIADLRRYRDLYQARQDTWEGNSRRAIEKLNGMFRGEVRDEVSGFIRAAAYDKLLYVAWLVNHPAKEGRGLWFTRSSGSRRIGCRDLWDDNVISLLQNSN